MLAVPASGSRRLSGGIALTLVAATVLLCVLPSSVPRQSEDPASESTLCTGLHDFQLTACRVQHRPKKRERHLRRMEKCAWRNEPGISYKMQFLSHPPDRSTADTCVVSEAEGDWIFFRLGPIFTSGGYSWENVLSVFDDRLLAPWRGDDGTVMVRDFILGSSDRTGALIGHPPLHQHHFHFYFDTNLNHMALNNHGDSDCSEAQEGVYCQYMEYPPEVAFYLPSKIGIVSTVNDVRPAGSPLLESYFFAGILLPPRVTPRPRPLTLQNIYLAPKAYMHSQEQYAVNSSTQSVLWTDGEIDKIDSVVAGWFHLHREVVDELWVIEGDVDSLALDAAPWAAAREAFITGDGVIAAFKAHLRTQMELQPQRTRLLCAIGHEPDFLDFRRRWCQFDPRPDGVLKYVYLGFYEARKPGLPNPYRMHSGFYLHTTTTDDQMTATNIYWERRPQYDAVVYALSSKFDDEVRSEQESLPTPANE